MISGSGGGHGKLEDEQDFNIATSSPRHLEAGGRSSKRFSRDDASNIGWKMGWR